MTKILTVQNIHDILAFTGLETFFQNFITHLESDFRNWQSFDKRPRPAFHSAKGVIELMPIANQEYFACKTVNGHPANTLENKFCVAATGQLCTIGDGYAKMICEMTLMTALRTGAASALVSKYMAKKDSKVIKIIGCGSQSEFQILAHKAIFDITTVYYYDIDQKAMDKFSDNLKGYGMELIQSNASDSDLEHADIIITCIAEKSKVILFDTDLVKAGTHICGIGGDCPGKTELDPKLLTKADKIIVEFLKQTEEEGEIQNYSGDCRDIVHGEIWQIVSGFKTARENDSEVTFYDAVGFALEDFSVMTYFDKLSETTGIYESFELIPEVKDCKNLFSRIQTKTMEYIGHGDTKSFLNYKII
jgi:ornithine cyclodeaminase